MAVMSRKQSQRRNTRAALTRRETVTPAQDEYARAVLDPHYGLSIVEDDPLAPDAAVFLDLDSGLPDPVSMIRADADSKRTNRCAGCGKWYMTRAQLARHRERMHGVPSPASRRIATGTRKPSPPAMDPTYTATDGGSDLGPCPRCGRIDWQTARGRTWHLDNNPSCAAFRKAQHQYVTIGG